MVLYIFGLWMSFCGSFRLFDAVVGGIGSPPSDPGKEFFSGSSILEIYLGTDPPCHYFTEKEKQWMTLYFLSLLFYHSKTYLVKEKSYCFRVIFMGHYFLPIKFLRNLEVAAKAVLNGQYNCMF